MKENEPRLLYEGFARDIEQTLPLVFTESLSYVQCIYLLYRKVNEIISILNNMIDLWNRLQDFQTIIQSWDEPIQDIIICNDNDMHYAFNYSTIGFRNLVFSLNYRDMEMPIEFTISNLILNRGTILPRETSRQIIMTFINEAGMPEQKAINEQFQTTLPLTLKVQSPFISLTSNDCIVPGGINVVNGDNITLQMYGLIPININIEDGSTILSTWTNGNNKPPTQSIMVPPAFVAELWSTGNEYYCSVNNHASRIFKINYAADAIPLGIYLPSPYKVNLSTFIGHTIIYCIEGELTQIDVSESNKLYNTWTEKNLIYDVTDNKYVTVLGNVRFFTPEAKESLPRIAINPRPAIIEEAL